MQTENKMNVRNIAIKQISNDNRFQFSNRFKEKFDKLYESIEEIGIRTPVSVIKAEGQYQILAGFSRFRAAVMLEFTHVPAVQYSHFHVKESFHAVLLEHVCCADLNILEKARILHILDTLSLETDDWVPFLDVLELPMKNSLLQDLRRLTELEKPVQDYLERYDTALRQAALFFPLPPDQQRLLVDLAGTLQIRPVELQEIASQLLEISHRDSMSLQSLFGELGISYLLGSEESRGRKLAEIRETLFQKRYPRLNGWNRQIDNARKRMKLPPGAQLKWDKNLEAPGISMHVHFKSPEDVADFAKALSHPVVQPAFQEIFEVL